MMNVFKHLSLQIRLLLAICVFLTLIIVLEVLLLNGSAAQADVAATHSAESLTVAAAPPIPPIKPLRTYGELSERPLFTDTRRPPPPPANGAMGQRTDVTKAWKLTGVVVAGEHSHAFVQGARDKAIRRIEVGAVLDGWTLTEITPAEIRFAAGDAVARLELREEKASR